METLVPRLLTVVVLITLMTLAWWIFLPDPDPELRPQSGWTVVSVTDGDTVVVEREGMSERVRMIGIDAPERGECGYEEARQFLVDVIEGQEVTLVAGATTDRDVHDRLLRYVEYGGLDVGLGLIGQGLVDARYDSRTNQPHPREDDYREADRQVPHICEPS